MNKRQLTAIYYFSFIMCLAMAIIFVYILMDKLETSTSIIEQKIRTRDIKDIIDQNYRLDMTTVKNEDDEFLNELTGFFYNFHKNSEKTRSSLNRFNIRRKAICKRFEASKITYFNLSIPQNRMFPYYIIKFSPEQNYFSNIPFFKEVRLSPRSRVETITNTYFMCFARLLITSFTEATISLQITESKVIADDSKYMKFKLIPNEEQIVSLNRIIFIRSMKTIRLIVSMRSRVPIKVQQTEANCVMFEDVK